jgi:hypothetical protein
MRYTRVKRFRKTRYRKMRRLLLFAVVMPLTLVLLGYLVASLIILPSMAG